MRKTRLLLEALVERCKGPAGSSGGCSLDMGCSGSRGYAAGSRGSGTGGGSSGGVPTFVALDLCEEPLRASLEELEGGGGCVRPRAAGTQPWAMGNVAAATCSLLLARYAASSVLMSSRRCRHLHPRRFRGQPRTGGARWHVRGRAQPPRTLRIPQPRAARRRFGQQAGRSGSYGLFQRPASIRAGRGPGCCWQRRLRQRRRQLRQVRTDAGPWRGSGCWRRRRRRARGAAAVSLARQQHRQPGARACGGVLGAAQVCRDAPRWARGRVQQGRACVCVVLLCALLPSMLPLPSHAADLLNRGHTCTCARQTIHLCASDPLTCVQATACWLASTAATRPSWSAPHTTTSRWGFGIVVIKCGVDGQAKLAHVS